MIDYESLYEHFKAISFQNDHVLIISLIEEGFSGLDYPVWREFQHPLFRLNEKKELIIPVIVPSSDDGFVHPSSDTLFSMVFSYRVDLVYLRVLFAK